MADPAEKVETTADATEGETKETVEGVDAKADESAAEEGDKATEAKAGINPDEYKPEERQRPWSNRQERAEFFREKQKPAEGEPAPADETDLSTAVAREVAKVLTPFQQRLSDEADDREISSFLSQGENKERFGKYEALARKEMKVYQNLPISKIFRALAFEDAERIGAEKADKAREAGTRRSVRGTGTAPRRSDSGLPDFSRLSPKEMDEFNRRVSKGETFQTQ